MKRIIGIGKPRPAPPTISDNIEIVDRKAEDVRGKVANCDAELVRIREQMSKLRRGSDGHNVLVEKAKRVLQRKKRYESMEANLEQQSFNMEQATSALQGAKITQQIVSSMKTSVKEIKKVNKKMDLDEIDDLHEKMEEVVEMSNVVQEALGRTFPGIPDIDEDQLQAELDEIIMDDDKSYLDVPSQNPSIERPSHSSNSTVLPSTGERQVGPRPQSLNTNETNGILVDEFGLPVIENQVHNM